MCHSPFTAFITRLTFDNFFLSEPNTRSINFYWSLYKHFSELEVFKETNHLDVVVVCIILFQFPFRSHTCYSKYKIKFSQTMVLLCDSRRRKYKITLGKCEECCWGFFKFSEPRKKILISLRVKRNKRSFLSHFDLFKIFLFCPSM